MEKIIYIAEDDPNIRNLEEAFLEKSGYKVLCFENGDLLYDKFKKDPADLVILDIMMPGTDGLSLCATLRKESSVPIIIVSAKGSDMERVAGVLKKRAQERRTYLEANRALTDWMHDLDDTKNISILVSPLVSEKESMLNAIENEQSDGERSTGVLSASDESLSEVAEESDDGSKRVHIDASQGNDTARKENAQNAELEGIQMTFQRKQQFWSDDSLFLNQESFSTF